MVAYTPEATKELVDRYNAGEPLPQIAAALKVPERSVIAKLSSLGLRRRAPYVSKNGEPPVRKSKYVEDILNILEIEPSLGDSLEKCNKFLLKAILDRLNDGK